MTEPFSEEPSPQASGAETVFDPAMKFSKVEILKHPFAAAKFLAAVLVPTMEFVGGALKMAATKSEGIENLIKKVEELTQATEILREVDPQKAKYLKEYLKNGVARIRTRHTIGDY